MKHCQEINIVNKYTLYIHCICWICEIKNHYIPHCVLILFISSYLTIINSLWLSDTTSCLRTGPTLVQILACCLMALSHYLNWCSLIISDVLWHSLEPISNAHDSYPWYEFKIIHLRLQPHLPGTSELMYTAKYFSSFTLKVSRANENNQSNHSCFLQIFIYPQSTTNTVVCFRSILYNTLPDTCSYSQD